MHAVVHSGCELGRAQAPAQQAVVTKAACKPILASLEARDCPVVCLEQGDGSCPVTALAGPAAR